MIWKEKIIVTLIISLLFFSCKIERLKDDTTHLIGKWLPTNGFEGSGGVIDINDPYYFEVEFRKSGCIIAYNSAGDILEKARIKNIEYYTEAALSNGGYLYAFKIEVAQTDYKTDDWYRLEGLTGLTVFINYPYQNVIMLHTHQPIGGGTGSKEYFFRQ